MPMNKKQHLVAAMVTLALLMASPHRATGFESRTGIMCTSQEMCVPICLHRGGGYTGGYCSTEHVVGDPSCVCTKPHPPAQSTTAVDLPEEQPASDGDVTAGGRMGTAS